MDEPVPQARVANPDLHCEALTDSIGAMETTITSEEQYALVYQGIQAIARNCDGAQTADGVGFNGQDTHFGRRIASVPFEEWTEDVKAEAARISRTYRTQIETYTGIDVAALPVVQAASEYTNHVARDDARKYERQGEKQHRQAKLVDGRIRFTWSAKDPDCFGVLLSEVRSLPGRRWDGSCNEVSFTAEAVDFIERHAIAADFDLTVAKAEAALVAAEEAVKPHLTLEGDRIRISFPYDPTMVAEVRNLPGRKYDFGSKTNTVFIDPEVLAFADRHGLRVSPEVVEAVEAHTAAQGAAITKAQIMASVSRAARPEDLPADFLALLKEAK